MSLYAFEDLEPQIAADAYVHPEAVLIGDVQIGVSEQVRCCVPILEECGSNVQENCVIHVTPGREARVEENAVIAHGAKIRDANVKAGAVVGINAVLLHGVVVEEEAMVAAGTVVSNSFVVSAKKIVAGNPARIKGERPEMYVQLLDAGLKMYQELPENYRKGLRKILN